MMTFIETGPYRLWVIYNPSLFPYPCPEGFWMTDEMAELKNIELWDDPLTVPGCKYISQDEFRMMLHQQREVS